MLAYDLMQQIESFNQGLRKDAEDIANNAIETIQMAAKYGHSKGNFQMHRDFDLDTRSINMARAILRDHGLRLSFHHRSRDFSISIDLPK